MEKRLLLSIVLSFVVLYVWSAAQPKKQLPQTTKSTQIAENKEDTRIEPSSPPPAFVSLPKEIAQSSFQEETHTISNDVIAVSLSNVGGVIKRLHIDSYGVELPIVGSNNVKAFKNLLFEAKESSRNKIVFESQFGQLIITRSYEVQDDEYQILESTRIYNDSEMSNLIDFDVEAINLDMSILSQSQNDHTRDQALFEYSYNLDGSVVRKGNAHKFSEKEAVKKEGMVSWLGFRDRYFAFIIRPEYKVETISFKALSNNKLDAYLNNPRITIQPKETAVFEHSIYIGPQKLTELKKYDKGYDEIMSFSGFGLFNMIAKAIYQFMHFTHKFIPNWGVVILVVSITIYLLMYPLTLKGMSSMKKMQSLQPKMADLREKHKNNPQKLNKEMVELYKKYKINPMGGCLPFLFQMPVFIGLYQVLWRSVSFKGAEFLWIKDLSEPDRLFLLPFKLPFIGNEFNILPVLMMIIMFVQQKASAKNMTLTDPMQIQQQKMMSTIFPVFLGFLFYKFASGLTLYFTVFYIFSAITQIKMMKEAKAV